MEFKRRVDQKTRMKIGRGVERHYDKKGRKKKVLGIAAVSLVGGGIGLLALKKQNLNSLKEKGIIVTSGRKGSATNPIVENLLPYTKTPSQLPNKVKKVTNQARRTFTDTLGKLYKKGSFLPSGGKGKAVSDVGLVKKGKTPISVAKQDKFSQEQQVTINVDSRNRRAQEGLFSFEPYSIDFAKEEKVDSYVTKKGKRVKSFRRKRDKKHLLDDPTIKTRYVNQSRIFDKRVNEENAKEVFDAEDKGNKVGQKISTIATPLALYGLGKFALSRNKNAKSLFESKIAATNKKIDALTDAAQKGSYSANLNRVHKLGLEMNSLGELGQKGISKKARAYMIGQRAKVTDKAIGLTGKAAKGFNKFNALADVGVDVLAGPVQYKTRTINTKQGPVNMTLPTVGSMVKRQVIPGLVVGVPIAVVAQKVAKDRYFKNKEKEKNEKTKRTN